ncbi:MAG: translation initiation factor IF-3, partial [Acetobacter orientalis]
MPPPPTPEGPRVNEENRVPQVSRIDVKGEVAGG